MSKDRKTVIRFDVVSPDEIKRQSIGCCNASPTRINNDLPRITDINDRVFGALADPKGLSTGSTREFVNCGTCDAENPILCAGHFGHIELQSPMYHCGFMKPVEQLLQSVCFVCSRLRVRFSDHKNAETDRWLPGTKPFLRKLAANSYQEKTLSKLAKLCKKKQYCTFQGCAAEFPTITFKKKVLYITTGKQRKELLAADAYAVLKNIPEDEIAFLQLSYQPSWLIMTRMFVPPNAIRPTIYFGTKIGRDDLTRKLLDIIRNNEMLLDPKNERIERNERNERILQSDITAFIDASKINQNTVTSYRNRNKKPMKSIVGRIQTKAGRVRNNLLGKRTDFTARNVITGDPTLDLDEVGIPQWMAQHLTVPVLVNDRNQKQLLDLILKGPFQYPGANSIIRHREFEGKMKKYTVHLWATKKPVTQLQHGDIVERHLVTGDACLLNRQPSLHKESMMMHRIRVMPGTTFRLNLSVTPVFNADFDGDEMNIHIPQSWEAIAETRELANVNSQIVSGQYNRPIMSIVQDTLNAMYRLTADDGQLFSVAEWQQFIYQSGIDDISSIPTGACNGALRLKGKSYFTGKQIASILFPKDFCYPYRVSTPTEKSRQIYILDGVIQWGQLSKKSLGPVDGGILQVLWRDYGHSRCALFMVQIQKLAVAYCERFAHSVSYQDLCPPVSVEKQIDYERNQFRHYVPFVNEDCRAISSADDDSVPVLSTLTTRLSQIVQDGLNANNQILVMANSGSKGNATNTRQLSAVLGQQLVAGRRPAPVMQGRTLPHFHALDVRPAAHGYVFGNFREGLNATEYFFHAQGGREGLTDTSVKTSEVGYIQRRVVKALEDLTVRYDGTVRNANNDILQFSYGDCGTDASCIESVEVVQFGMNDDQLNEIASCSDEVILLIQARDTLRQYHPLKELGDVVFYCPYQPVRHIMVHTRNTSQATNIICPLSFSDFNAMLCNALEPIATIHPQLMCIIRLLLPYQFVVYECGLQTVSSWGLYLQQIIIEWEKSRVQPGEAVGTLAAQSMGEPLTQLALNAFHSSGSMSRAVVKGIPMFRSLLNNPREADIAGMTVVPIQSILHDQAKVQELANMLPTRTLYDIVDNFSIQYAADGCVAEDQIWWDVHYALYKQSNHKPWLLRLELSVVKLLMYRIHPNVLKTTIENQFKDNALRVIVSPIHCPQTNLSHPQCIVYLSCEGAMSTFWDTYAISLLQSLQVAGLKDITQAVVIPRNCLQGGYHIETTGINMQGLAEFDLVDWTQTVCTRVGATQVLLGLEASKAVLLKQFTQVFKNSGSYVNAKHLKMVCDRITYLGQIKSIHRTGTQSERNLGTLDRASYEKTSRILMDAALYGDTDPLTGMSAQLMVGKPLSVGTHAHFNIHLDMLQLEKGFSPSLMEIDLEEKWAEEEEEEYVPEL